MADFSGLKRKQSTLGKAPTMDEASTNLEAPEFAPAPPSVVALVPPTVRKDGRSQRKTGRVVQFSTRVTPEFDADIRAVAERDGLKLAELLEEMLRQYKR